MTEPMRAPPQDAMATVAVFPHRSLSRAGLVSYFVVQSIATLGFALLAAWRGVTLAPALSVLVLLLLGWCLRRVWRSGGSGVVVTVTAQRVEIRRTSDGVALGSFHPYWVRLRLAPARWPGWPGRLLMGSHGREVEIGPFLNEAERRELAQRLTELLRAAHARGGESETGIR